jgi:hypothetical protein
MLQKVTKGVRCAHNGHVQIKLAAIDQNERGCGENRFRETPPGHERLRFWILCRFSGDDVHYIYPPNEHTNWAIDPIDRAYDAVGDGDGRRHAKQAMWVAPQDRPRSRSTATESDPQPARFRWIR